ncbi:MAG: NYN domain-containing protein [Cytophagales bacterium]|nr:NYN domain-containing protein [Cytophagales bacterium]
MSNRTAVFVDGYNLYYGRLRGTPYKWFDLVAFSDQLLAHRAQGEVLTRVHLCTAYVSSTFATHGRLSAESQGNYHRALEAMYSEKIKIIYGEHSWNKAGTEMPVFNQSVPFNRANVARVWKIEEKMTDVNLALSMYRECSKNLCDRLIVISNDRDIAPALEAIKADFPHVQCGVVFSLKPPPKTAVAQRRRSGTLEDIADWSLPFIDNAALLAAQMPGKVPVAGKKTIFKPAYW